MATIASYEQAKAALKGRQSKKLQNNTYAELNHDGSIGIRLHATQVVIYFPDGRVRLTSGGWRTVTTKDRLNEYSPFYVMQKNHAWTVFDNQGAGHYQFVDGMVFKLVGSVWAQILQTQATPEILGVDLGEPSFDDGREVRITRIERVTRRRKEHVAYGEEI